MSLAMAKAEKRMQNTSQDIKLIKIIRTLFIRILQMAGFLNKSDKS